MLTIEYTDIVINFFSVCEEGEECWLSQGMLPRLPSRLPREGHLETCWSGRGHICQGRNDFWGVLQTKPLHLQVGEELRWSSVEGRKRGVGLGQVKTPTQVGDLS